MCSFKPPLSTYLHTFFLMIYFFYLQNGNRKKTLLDIDLSLVLQFDYFQILWFWFTALKTLIENIISQILAKFKIKESQYIELFVISRSIKKLFSVDLVNAYFSQSTVNYLFSIHLKVWGTPHYLYRNSLTLII